MNQVTPSFGQGFYTAADISRILGLPYPNIAYWFRKYIKDDFEKTTGFRYYYDYENITAVNFSTLIELYVFDFFRNHRISGRKIADAHRELSKYYKTPYPFCLSDILYLSGRDIVYQLESLLFVAGTGFQYAIQEYLKAYIQKIFFVDNIAAKYYPLGKDRSIVVNPKNQFGQPIIDGTNIQTNTLSSLYRGGDKIDFISRLYNLKEQQVKDAIEFDKAA